MSEQVEKAANLETKAVELIDQLTEGLKAVAPQMADVTLAAIQVEALVTLCITLGWTAVTAVAAYWLYRWFRWVHSWTREDNKPSTSGADYSVRGIIAFIAGCVASVFLGIMQIIACVSLTSTSMWVAIVDPRLALALRVINRLM